MSWRDVDWQKERRRWFAFGERGWRPTLLSLLGAVVLAVIFGKCETGPVASEPPGYLYQQTHFWYRVTNEIARCGSRRWWPVKKRCLLERFHDDEHRYE